MLKLTGDLGFLHEAPDHAVVTGVLGMQYLDRDVTTQITVATLQDDSDSATGQLTLDLVASITVFQGRPGRPAARRSSRRPPASSRSRTLGLDTKGLLEGREHAIPRRPERGIHGRRRQCLPGRR